MKPITEKHALVAILQCHSNLTFRPLNPHQTISAAFPLIPTANTVNVSLSEVSNSGKPMYSTTKYT